MSYSSVVRPGASSISVYHDVEMASVGPESSPGPSIGEGGPSFGEGGPSFGEGGPSPPPLPPPPPPDEGYGGGPG